MSYNSVLAHHLQLQVFELGDGHNLVVAVGAGVALAAEDDAAASARSAEVGLERGTELVQGAAEVHEQLKALAGEYRGRQVLLQQVQLAKAPVAAGLVVVVLGLNEVNVAPVELLNFQARVIEPGSGAQQRGPRLHGRRYGPGVGCRFGWGWLGHAQPGQRRKGCGPGAPVVGGYDQVAGSTEVEARKRGAEAFVDVGVEAAQHAQAAAYGLVGFFISRGEVGVVLAVFVQQHARLARAKGGGSKLRGNAALRGGAGPKQVVPGVVLYQAAVLRQRVDAHNLVLAGVAGQQLGARLIDGPNQQVHAGQLGLGQHLLQLQGVSAGVVGKYLQGAAGPLQ